MYHQVGRVDLPPIPAFDLTWNPPGWGSLSGESIIEFARSLIDGDIQLAMIVGIKPGGHIPFHTDNPGAENGLSGSDLERLHIILQTNRNCWNFHDGSWLQLEEGGIYTMNPFLEHASINLGDTVRLHLVVDRLRQV